MNKWRWRLKRPITIFHKYVGGCFRNSFFSSFKLVIKFSTWGGIEENRKLTFARKLFIASTMCSNSHGQLIDVMTILSATGQLCFFCFNSHLWALWCRKYFCINRLLTVWKVLEMLLNDSGFGQCVGSFCLT